MELERMSGCGGNRYLTGCRAPIRLIPPPLQLIHPLGMLLRSVSTIPQGVLIGGGGALVVHYYLAVRGPLSDKVGTLQLLTRATRLLLLADVDKVPELVQVLVVGRRQLASDDSARHLHATHDVLIIPKQLGQPGGHEFCKQRDNIGGDVLVQEVRGGVQVVGQNNPTGGGERTHLHIAGQALQYLGVCLLCVSGVETHYLPRGTQEGARKICKHHPTFYSL